MASTREALVQAAGALGRAWDAVVDLVFPPECLVCRQALEPGEKICPRCRAELVARREFPCPRCGAERPAGQRAEADCGHCRTAEWRFDRLFSLGPYEGLLRTVVLRMKRRHEESLALAIGGLLGEELGPRLSEWGPHVVVATPMHFARRFGRGTNSSELLAEAVARRLRIPAAPRGLARIRNTLQQNELTPAGRKENVRRAMRARRGYEWVGCRAVVVDDVLTTGATCSEAARALRAAGAAEVWVVTAARAGLWLQGGDSVYNAGGSIPQSESRSPGQDLA